MRFLIIILFWFLSQLGCGSKEVIVQEEISPLVCKSGDGLSGNSSLLEVYFNAEAPVA